MDFPFSRFCVFHITITSPLLHAVPLIDNYILEQTVLRMKCSDVVVGCYFVENVILSSLCKYLCSERVVEVENFVLVLVILETVIYVH